jgi:hypothetical protein
MLIEREQPYVSSNTLAKYMAAQALQRKQMVKEQKYPSSYIRPRYTPAEIAITGFLADKERHKEVMFRQIERLCSKNTITKWRVERKRSCIEAVEAFLDIADDIQLDGVEFHKCNRTLQQSLELAGVTVSIRPEGLLTGRDRQGKIVTGAVKLHFSKSRQLNEVSGAYAATLVHHYMVECGTTKVSPSLCFVVDVFGRQVFRAPRAYARQLANLEAGCEEIARAWKDV